jgi:hypothetical protein
VVVGWTDPRAAIAHRRTAAGYYAEDGRLLRRAGTGTTEKELMCLAGVPAPLQAKRMRTAAA